MTRSISCKKASSSDLAIEALKVARLNRAKWKLKAGGMWIATDYVFVDEAGRRLHPNILTDAFRRICERLGLHYRLHDMRHTATTFMIRAGKDFGTVQKILGHSAASTTLNIYSHVLKGAKAEAVAALDRMLRKAVGDDEMSVRPSPLVARRVARRPRATKKPHGYAVSVGSANGNRTRLSALKGRCPNR